MHGLGLWRGWLVSHGVTWPPWTGETGRGFLRAQEQVNWRQSRHRVREGGEAEERCDLALCHFPLFPHSSCLVFLWQIGHNQAIHTFSSHLSLVNSKNAFRESFQTKSWVGGERHSHLINGSWQSWDDVSSKNFLQPRFRKGPLRRWLMKFYSS